MKLLADITIFAWPLVVLALFSVLQPRRAVLVAFVAGWLFLPPTEYSLPLFPDYSKMAATTCGVFLGIVLLDFPRLTQLRLRWFDVPITVFCISPFFSSISNGLGAYDGLSASIVKIVMWGLPYFIGRLYFATKDEVRELAIAIVIGGLVYMPLCWFEIRMSPTLSYMIYGEQGHWYNTVRLGGYRPIVFMLDGLMLGLWMSICTLIGYWLWRTKEITQLCGIPFGWIMPVLFGTTILCRSAGALLLLFVGIAVLELCRLTRNRIGIVCLTLIAILYLTTRISGIWSGVEATNIAAQIDEDRAQSLQFRLDNEDILIDKALTRPLFGWGGWGRYRIVDDWGKNVSIPDGLWIQTLGANGLLGLVSLYAALLIPIGRCISGFRRGDLHCSSPVWPLSVGAALFAIDCLLNAMENPVFVLVLGGLNSAAVAAATQPVALLKSVRCQNPSITARLWPRSDRRVSKSEKSLRSES